MFSTFTGSSRRPRNVNLSGQNTNPFSNTSWNPAVASNTTKTVTDAQAEREKRQLDRQRLKAVSRIQRAWRGYRARGLLKELRRSEFDEIYCSSSDGAGRRLDLASSLILSFFSPHRDDDLRRLFLLLNDCNHTNLHQIDLFNNRLSRLQDFTALIVQALVTLLQKNDANYPLQQLLVFINRLTARSPEAIVGTIHKYYAALAKLCQQVEEGKEWMKVLLQSLSLPLSSADTDTIAHDALAFDFLTCQNLVLFEKNIDKLGQAINMDKLAAGIVRGYSSNVVQQKSNDELLWLLAHFIDLGRSQPDSVPQLAYLRGLFIQTSALISDIGSRIFTQAPNGHAQPGPVTDDAISQPLAAYVSQQLLSLIDSKGIAKLLHQFSVSLTQSLDQESQGTSLVSGYILTLLQIFPLKADDVRMRLFLEEIPTTSGPIPILKFLWHIMHRTSLFANLQTERENPVLVLRRYLSSTSTLMTESIEEQEWRIVLLFLELYIFILRLSDDEDFFSGIYPRVLENNPSTLRIRACSLCLSEVEALTTFLKNTAFPLHYNVQDITRPQATIDALTQSRIDSFWSLERMAPGHLAAPNERPNGLSLTTPTKLDLGNLRSIVTTALKMVYERDSRKHFLPANHWLMTGKLENENFINAVIVEEKQNQEQADESDEEEEEEEEEEESMADTRHGDEARWHSTFASQRLSRHARIERLRVAQRRALKERQLAEMGPKLEILKHIPFVVPFEVRVKIFRQFIQLDRNTIEGNFPGNPLFRNSGRIRRGNLFEDAFDEFYDLGESFKDPIQITFVDQFDTPEAGIDGGGVTKEFLISVTSEAFGNENGLDMFTCNDRNLLYPNPMSVDVLRESLHSRGYNESHDQWTLEMSHHLRRFEFLGRIIGKCMYEGILVDLAFAGFFLLKWPSPGPKEENSYKGSINDLQDMDDELYKGLLRLKNYPGDVSELAFDFTITDQVSRPGQQPIKTVTKKLIPNGDQVSVTNDNRLLYISYTARHRLVIQPALQTAAFLRGLRDIIRPSWLSMFNQSELQRLVGGDSKEIDVEDLRRNTVYSGVYEIGDDGQEHPTIRMFWRVMTGFTDAQRRDVLKYVSSTPRAPLLGFAQLKPNFSIRDAGGDEERLPSTSTCVNLLKLPIYKRESTLRDKLLYAATSGAGFDLS